MIAFRDQRARELGLDLMVHINRDGLARGINPIVSGSALHTRVMKTEALKQALDEYGFDAAVGGARRDEEKSRAKERIFSFRSAATPGPEQPAPGTVASVQHPYPSGRVGAGFSAVELDRARRMAIHPRRGHTGGALYFAAPRPVVHARRNLVMVDDQRLPLEVGEVPELRLVRFRTLGCYPLSGAIESEAPA